MTRPVDVVILGAGQSGLAMSRCLSESGIDHVVLERGRIGERWISERWPSLRLLTPNWMNRLPGTAFAPSDPEGFMTGGAFLRELGTYADGFGAPVVVGAEVLRLDHAHGFFRVATTAGTWRARAVVIATGACDRPAVPGWAARLPDDIHQVTTDRYRSPTQLPAGGVLVVGASATGVQLAHEIRLSGRPVSLSVGRHVAAPRVYRGRDLMAWLDACGFLAEARPEKADGPRLMSQPSLQITGNRDAGEMGLGRLAESGIRIVGRAIGTANGTIKLEDSLTAERAAAERRRRKLLSAIDQYIRDAGIDAPEEPEAWDTPAPLPQAPLAVHLRAEGIRTVLWATGYRREYPWLRLPVLDDTGEIRNRGGVTALPGLFVLGLPFMRHRASSFIGGCGRDAKALHPVIRSHLEKRRFVAA